MRIRDQAAWLTLVILAGPPASDTTWDPLSADLDVTIAPDSTVTLAGVLRLRLAGDASRGPTLVLGGAGMAFDSVQGPRGAVITISTRRDSATARMPSLLHRGALYTLRAWWHLPSRVGRSVAVGRDGALVSWGGIWYPTPAWAATAQPNLLVSGTTRLTVPAEWRTLSNGTLVDSVVSGGVRSEVWRTAQAVARSFIAAPFHVTWQRVGSKLVGSYLLARHVGQAQAYAAAIPRMVAILARRFGPYPFESFAIAEVPRSLAPPGFVGRSEQGYFLAHTDALEGAGVNVPLFAHELAHMWLPNLVDSKPPGDDVMDEGFASYAVALVLELTDGDSAATAELVDGNPEFSTRGYFHLVRTGRDEPLMADYSPLIARAKSPMVLRMLRERLGDSRFFATLQAFIRQYAHRGASLTDLRNAFLHAAPRDTGLARFFAEWLDRAGAPVLDVTWEAVTSAGSPRIRVKVVQLGDRYHLPLELVVHGADGVARRTVSVTDSVQVFVFDTPGAPRSVEVDPGHRLLLWRPEFGPPGGAARTWSQERWRSWFDDQVRWLMQRYEVGGVSLSVANGGVRWHAQYGVAMPDAGAVIDAMLIDSLAVRGTADSLRISRRYQGNDVVVFAGLADTQQGAVIVARGGWGGTQLAMQLAQEIASWYGWRVLPRYP